MKKCGLILFVGLLVAGWGAPVRADDQARQLIINAIDYYRDVSSVMTFTMVIHRPDWERSMTMKMWTQGLDKSLVRIIAPAKDAGNGSLLLGDDMWNFSPKINRIIKIPPSMAHQSWMGSDFSNNDVARADDIIDRYDHQLLSSEQQDGHTVYRIQSTPHEDAPVVWGYEIITVRDDLIMLSHEFFDQDGQMVKKFTTGAIAVVAGKLIATRERMQKIDKPDEWTAIEVLDASFGVDINPAFFTLSGLRNPRN